MQKISATLSLLFLKLAFLSAQVDSLPLDADFRFQDGLYLSLQQLQANQPAYQWKEVEARLAANNDRYFAQMEYVRPRGLDPIPLEEIYAIVLDGLPYLRLRDSTLSRRATSFAGLRIRGRLCYYTFESKQEKMVEIAAYNPLTGRPFRKASVKRDESVLAERVLHLPTGRRGTLSRGSLARLMSDDPQMVRTVEALPDEGLEEKLYKCILVYDDRNPMKLPASPSKKKKD